MIAVALWLAAPALAQAQRTASDQPQPERWQMLANPAGPGSLAPRFAQAGDGTLYLSWLEKRPADAAAASVHALQYARLQTGANSLSFAAARDIASGSDWFANWADTPGLTMHSVKLWVAHWLQKSAASTYAYDIVLSISKDQGASWSAAFTPHHDNTPTEHGFISQFARADGSVGLFWLDGRATMAATEAATLASAANPENGGTHGSAHAGAHSGAMTLRTATLDATGNISQDELLDERVCDCCHTAAVSTPAADVIAYRNRSAGEIRDIAVLRRSAQGWSTPQIVHADGWRTAACPVNGPALAASGERVALAWFTMADDMPRVQLALSADAGASFAAPQTFSAATALGRVQLLAYADGWLLSWLDQPADSGAAVIRLASLSAAGDLRWQQQLSGVSARRVSGIPRIAALADGRIIVAWTAAWNGQGMVQTAVFTPRQ
ncbi:MAG: hypothetical protein Tsb0027_23570 [Wenzhouxiangellaceae bacterium]